MAFNPMALMKLKGMWEQFNAAHPKIVPYFNALRGGYLGEGSVIEVNVTDPAGRSLKCNLKLTAQDLELMQELSRMGSNV